MIRGGTRWGIAGYNLPVSPFRGYRGVSTSLIASDCQGIHRVRFIGPGGGDISLEKCENLENSRTTFDYQYFQFSA